MNRSQELFSAASKLIPGGVNSPVRAFGSVGGTPPFIAKSSGSRLWDEDGNEYIDYVNSWGPAIVGHAHPEVVAAVAQVARDGISFGAPTSRETELAQKIRELMPALEKMRLVSSGTEACMVVLRLARAFTGRDKIIKFTGCYHGHADLLLVQAGSGVATLGLPDSPGVPQGATQDTLVAPYNDIAALERLFANHGNEIAAIILEPICGNTGFIRPRREFLDAMQRLCQDHGSLLIFDEVMTGFRVGLGGAQGLFNIKPDLTTLGKVVGGGLNIGVYGGRAEIMDKVAPAGPMYQAGTLSGNPLAVACGLKTLEILTNPGGFKALADQTKKLVCGLKALADERGIPFLADCEGGMFGFFFTPEGCREVRCHEDAKGQDGERFRLFFHAMLSRGIYLAPSAFEAGFVSMAHTDTDIEQTLEAARASLAEC